MDRILFSILVFGFSIPAFCQKQVENSPDLKKQIVKTSSENRPQEPDDLVQPKLKSELTGVKKNEEDGSQSINNLEIINWDLEEYTKLDGFLKEIYDNPGKFDEDPELMKEKDPSFKHRDILIKEYKEILKAKRTEYCSLVHKKGLENISEQDKNLFNHFQDLNQKEIKEN